VYNGSYSVAFFGVLKQCFNSGFNKENSCRTGSDTSGVTGLSGAGTVFKNRGSKIIHGRSCKKAGKAQTAREARAVRKAREESEVRAVKEVKQVNKAKICISGIP